MYSVFVKGRKLFSESMVYILELQREAVRHFGFVGSKREDFGINLLRCAESLCRDRPDRYVHNSLKRSYARLHCGYLLMICNVLVDFHLMNCRVAEIRQISFYRRYNCCIDGDLRVGDIAPALPRSLYRLKRGDCEESKIIFPNMSLLFCQLTIEFLTTSNVSYTFV